MPMFLKTFKSIKAFASFNGINVERVGCKYHCWRRDDHSTVAESENLMELLCDIDDLMGPKKLSLNKS
jgi:hypothetical protein